MANKKTAVFAKSTKYKGELVIGGTEIQVTDKEFQELKELRLIKNPDSVKVEVKIDDKEIKGLSEKIKLAESENETLKAENETLKRVVSLNEKTVKDLTSLADTNNIDLQGKTDKDDIVLIIAKSDVEIETKVNFLE